MMEDCIFCKVIKGELPGKFAYRDREMVAFYDINPKAPVHVLLVPIKHTESLISTNDIDEKLLGKMMLKVRDIARDLGLDKEGYKVVINNGAGSGQLVYHLHIHILGGWRKSPGWEV